MHWTSPQYVTLSGAKSLAQRKEMLRYSQHDICYLIIKPPANANG